MSEFRGSRAYKYAEFAAADDSGKTPRYVARQCRQWLEIVDGGSDLTYFDEQTFGKIEKLLRLMVHPDLNCSMLDGLEDYALLFIAALFCTKSSEGKRYYTTGLLEIARKKRSGDSNIHIKSDERKASENYVLETFARRSGGAITHADREAAEIIAARSREAYNELKRTEGKHNGKL